MACALAESNPALKLVMLKINNFIMLWLEPALKAGIKPAVVYPIDPVFVKEKSLAKSPITVQAGQQIDAKISE